MNLPDTCPFCGAGVFTNFCGQNGWKEKWVAYECHTWIFMDRDRANNQSNLCIASERTRLAARVAELEAREKQRADDEAWANSEHVGCVERGECGWEAYRWSARMQWMDRVTAKTITDAIRALRAKVEGGAR